MIKFPNLKVLIVDKVSELDLLTRDTSISSVVAASIKAGWL